MPKIILMTGPSGSGKTTIAGSFLENQNDTWAYINQDEVRQFVKSGYETADDSRAEWNNYTKNQWDASIPLCVDIAKRYSKFGISSLIDFYSTNTEFQSKWKEQLKGVKYNLFVLNPSKDTVISRNASRTKPSRLSKVKMNECFDDFKDWKNSKEGFKIDNSNKTVENVVNQIIEHIK